MGSAAPLTTCSRIRWSYAWRVREVDLGVSSIAKASPSWLTWPTKISMILGLPMLIPEVRKVCAHSWDAIADAGRADPGRASAGAGARRPCSLLRLADAAIAPAGGAVGRIRAWLKSHGAELSEVCEAVFDPS